MPIRIERYQPGLAAEWAQVLRDAKNGIFLFERAFMEYHGDRFRDASLVAFEDDRPVALLPAAFWASPVSIQCSALTILVMTRSYFVRSNVIATAGSNIALFSFA